MKRFFKAASAVMLVAMSVSASDEVFKAELKEKTMLQDGLRNRASFLSNLDSKLPRDSSHHARGNYAVTKASFENNFGKNSDCIKNWNRLTYVKAQQELNGIILEREQEQSLISHRHGNTNKSPERSNFKDDYEAMKNYSKIKMILRPCNKKRASIKEALISKII